MMFVFLLLLPLLARGEVGPSARAKPFMKALVDDLRIVTLLSADGDAVAGIMDGLGAVEAADNASVIHVFLNHELKFTSGRTRDHGARGAYVSRLVLERETMRIIDVSDFLRDPAANGACDAARNEMFTRCSFDRLCSGDLPPASALFNGASGRGTRARIFFAGEEGDNFPRALAWIVDGAAARTAVPLPALGSMRFENVVLCPVEQDLTVAAVADDYFPSGFVGVYVGTKRSDAGASDVVRAGLTDGQLYAFAVDGLRGATEQTTTVLAADARFSLVAVRDGNGQLPAFSQPLRDQTLALNGTLFSRPEDLAWHPLRPNELLAVSSDNDNAFGGRSRLWSFEFDDIREPLRGGRARWLLDGSEGANMLDNIAVDARGVAFISEDGTSPSHNNRFVELDTRTAPPRLRFLAEHDFDQFAATSLDAEFSGQIDAAHLLGDGWLLVSSQAHSILLGDGKDADNQASQLLAVRVRAPELPFLYDVRVDNQPDGTARVSVRVLDADVAAPWTLAFDVGDGSSAVSGSAVNVTMLHAGDAAAAAPDAPFRRSALALAAAAHRFKAGGEFNVTATLTAASGATRVLRRLLVVPAPAPFQAPNEGLSSVGVALISVFAIVFILALIGLVVFLYKRRHHKH